MNKRLKEHFERAKAEIAEYKDKCEVLEEEYQSIKKQLQTEIENQKFLGENGFGFGGSFLEQTDHIHRTGDGSIQKKNSSY